MADHIRRCTRCILPENYPDVGFDAEGVCRVCRKYGEASPRRDHAAAERKLQRILDRYRGSGDRYDVLVPVSGGRDSSYTLLTLKGKYGMRCLAFNVDNGFQDPEAGAFAERSASILGVDFQRYSPDMDLLMRVYGRALRAVGEFCAACVVLIPTAIFRAAEKNGIRLIVTGFSRELESPPPETCYMDRVCFRDIMKDEFTMAELRKDFFFPSLKRMFAVKQIRLPDYLPWNETDITEALAGELNFHRGISQIRYDCTAAGFSDYLFRLRTGFGKYEYLYANMVRAGVVPREEALRILRERESPGQPAGFGEFLGSLGCSVSDLDDIRGKSVYRFRTRNGLIRNAARKFRSLLP